MEFPKNPAIKGLRPGSNFHCRALDIGLGVLIAAVPLASYPFAVYGLKWAVLGLLTPLICFFWLRGGCGHPFRPLPTLFAPFAALLLAAELSVVQALNLYYALQWFVFFLFLFLVYFAVAYTCSQPERQALIIRYLLLTLLVVSIVSLFGCTMNCSSESLELGQTLFRLFGNTNYGAAYLIMVIPLSLALFLDTPGWGEKALWGTTLFFSIMLLTLSMVRGAWVSTIIGFAILLWVLSRGELREARRLFIRGGLVVGAALVVASVVKPLYLPGQESLGHRVASIFDLGTGSLQFRLGMWKGTLRMIWDHLWTGVGIGNFTFAFVPYRLTAIYQDPSVRVEHSHNEYLNLWAELGVLGLLALVWLFVRLVRLAWHLARRSDVKREVLGGVLGGLVAALAYAHLFYVAHLPASAMTAAILLGMIDGMGRKTGKQERAKPIRQAPLLVGFLVMLLLGVEYFVRPLAGEMHYWAAEQHFRERRIEMGLNRLERSLEWDPQSFAARYRRAAIFYAMKRYPETIREAEMATKIHPTMDVAYGLMGSAYLNQGKKAKAKEIFQQALALNPNYPDALNNLGVIAAEEGRFAEAEAMFLQAKEILGRTKMKPYANLGQLYEMTGRTREALEMYETAVTIQPTSASSWFHVARLRALTGGLGEAYEPLARAIALDEAWRSRAAKNSAFTAMRQIDPRMRTLLHPTTNGQ